VPLHSPVRCNSARRSLRRTAVSALLALAVLAGIPGTAAAVPPPVPPNPGDSQLAAANADARAKANAVDKLAEQLASAQAQLDQIHQQLGLTKELANKALVDLTAAQDAVAAAAAAQVQAQAEVISANAAAAEAEQQAARFIVSSFQNGSTVSVFNAYLGSTGPQDLLDRSALLNAVSGSKLDMMKLLDRTRRESETAHSAARNTKTRADAAATQATTAKHAADQATQAVMQTQQAQTARAKQLEMQRNLAQFALDSARQSVAGLQGQRLAFDQWDAQRRANAATSATSAAAAARAQILAAGGALGSAPASAAAQTVIKRTATQLGITYAWGGGNKNGPTLGVRDGGEADTFGDYNKIGFDCSGLMMYGFAGIGASLPHYAGYQYTSGRQFPLSQIQPGDMIFYGLSGIHHVALYIGDSKMIEAPQSGDIVKVSAVRYDDLIPNATRLT
jgi:cell wall-associated NlpC family hydrolase